MDSLRKQLYRLTIPIFVEIALVMLVGAVDVFMLSSCGDGVVAAVGLDNQLISLIFLVYQFASIGLGIVCAQYHGAGLRQRLVQVVGIALMVNLALGVVHTRVHIPRYPWAWFVPFPWRELRNLFKVGFPAMGEELSYCLSQVAITFFITRISTDALTTRTYAMNLIMFVFLFCLSITHGGDILVGHLVGKKRYQPAYLIGNHFLRQSMAITMACSVCLAAADPVYPLVVGVISQWGIAVGLAWIFAIPFGWGLIGAWVAFMLDENIRGVILMRRWHTKGWVGKSLS